MWFVQKRERVGKRGERYGISRQRAIGELLGPGQESRSYLTHTRKIGYLKQARTDLTSNKGVLCRLKVVRVK